MSAPTAPARRPLRTRLTAWLGAGPPAVRRLRVAVTVAGGLVALVLGWAVAQVPDDPRPLLVLLVLAAAVVGVAKVDLAAAALAFTVAANLAHVAVNVHELPSPTDALLVVVLLGILVRRDRLAFVPPPRAIVPLAAYALVVVASTLWATHPDRSLEFATDLVKDITVGILVAVVVRRTRSLRLVLWAVAAAVVLLAGIAVVQYATGTFERPYGGLGGAVVANIIGGLDDWRMTGPFGDPNYFGQTLVVAVPIALNRMLFERHRGLRLLASVAVVVLVGATITTFSRGAALALAIVVLTLLLTRSRQMIAVALVVAAVGLAIAVVPQEYRERLQAARDVTAGVAAAEDPAVRGRASEMLAGALMLAERPLTGVGAGNYSAHYQQYAQQLQLDLRGGERSAHSLYVEIGAETGLPGLAAFLFLVVAGARALRRCRRWGPRAVAAGSRRGLTEGLALALVAFLATSLLLHAIHTRIFWLLAAIALALPDDEEEHSSPAADAEETRQLPAGEVVH